MADPDLQGTGFSNNTANTTMNVLETSMNEVSVSPLPSSWSLSLGHPTSDSSSDFSTCLTVRRETLLEECHQNVPPPKFKHDTHTECGNTIDLDSFSLRLANTEEKDEGVDTNDTNKRDIGELQESRQKRTVRGIDKLEEKKAVDIADAKSVDDISEVQPLRLFNFPLREIAIAPHNSSSVINQSGELSANTSSILPRSVQHSSSPCTIDYLVSFIGGEKQHKKTECASLKPLANSHSAFKTRFISTGKPPLPPGAVRHLKEGVAAKANKIHFLNMPQDLRKRIRLSESSKEKVFCAAESDNEGHGERGNSNPPYRRADTASKGLATKCGIFDKVTSSDTNSPMEMASLSDYILAGHPESSVQANSLPQQEVLVFGNYIVKKSLDNQGTGKGNRKNISTLDPKTKLSQLSNYCASGKVHRQSFFEEENKHIQELTIGESSYSNNGATLQVTSGSLQHTSGLLLTTFAPISRGQESYGSLATSLGDNMPGNMAKYSSENIFHLKSWKDDIIHCDGQPSSRDTSTTDKSKMTISTQQAGYPSCSLQNIDRIQLQASTMSSTDSLSCEEIFARNYKANAEHCLHIDRDNMNTMKRDYGSHNKTHLKGPVNFSQAERSNALQASFKSAIEQLHYNDSESAEGYSHRSGSCSIDADFRKVDCDTIQRQPNQVNVEVCNLDSQHEGMVLGAGSEVVLSRLEIGKASQETSGSKRLSAYEKDVHEQHHGSLHVPYLGDNMTSCLQRYPCHIDHQATSSVADLNFTSFGENTMGPALNSAEGKDLQRRVGSSRLQRKIDAASVLSHPWIQRWRPPYQIASSLCKMSCGSLTNKKFRSLPHPFAPMKMMPSAAAMAIVGIAARQLPPCHLQKKGSLSVWSAVGFSMNRTTSSQ